MKIKFKINENNIDEVKNFAAIMFGEHKQNGDKHKFDSIKDVYGAMLEYILGSDDRAESFLGSMTLAEVRNKYLQYEFDLFEVFFRSNGKKTWYSRKKGKDGLLVGLVYRKKSDENAGSFADKMSELNKRKACNKAINMV